MLDDQHHLVGMISEKDCLRLIVDQAYYNMPPETRKVSDYMTPKVQSLSPKTTVVEAAIEFLNSPIRRFPIVENGMLIGQVSRRHILKAAQDMKSTDPIGLNSIGFVLRFFCSLTSNSPYELETM